MSGPQGGPVEGEQASALEDAIDDGLGEVVIVEHAAPGVERLVGGEDHRALAAVAIVDHVEEHVGRVGAVGEVSDLVHHQQGGMGVGGESLGQAPGAKGGRELVDELGGGDEESVESVLDGAVGDGHGQVGLAAAGLAREDQAAALGDEVGAESGAEQ